VSWGRRIRDGKGKVLTLACRWEGVSYCIFIGRQKVQIESARDLLSEKKIFISQISRKPVK
jgi:hypothetical protein